MQADTPPNVGRALPDGYSDVAPGKVAAVVTHLEMRVRPEMRPGPARTDLALRHVLKPGVDWYRSLFRRVGEDWLWFSRLTMEPLKLGGIIQHPDVEVFALEAAGTEAGLLELDFRVAGECELSYFGVTPRMVGTGAGRFLMNAAIERAWGRSISRFWVHICTLDHPAALAFYVRSGFTPFRVQVEVADDPRHAGVLPRTAAPQVPLVG